MSFSSFLQFHQIPSTGEGGGSGVGGAGWDVLIFFRECHHKVVASPFTDFDNFSWSESSLGLKNHEAEKPMALENNVSVCSWVIQAISSNF